MGVEAVIATQVIDTTSVGRSVMTAADAAAVRTAIGLGTLATQDGTFSGTSSGTNTGDQNLFSTIAVSGQSSVVADAASDTLTLVAGTNITITTDAGTDTITITAASGGVTGTGSVDNAVLRADGTGGATLQSSAWIINDNLTASPNNTVNHACLEATGGTTNVSISLKPKGSGSFSLHVPDGTSTGGNARGANAVDLQTARSSAIHVASGDASAVIAGAGNRATGPSAITLGGDGNTASGQRAVTLGGISCIASAQHAIAGGFGGQATGNMAFAIGYQCVASGSRAVTFGNYSSASGEESFAHGYRSTASAKWAIAHGCDGNGNKQGQRVHSSGRFSALGDAQGSELVVRNNTTNATQTQLFLDGASLRITLPNDSTWAFDCIIVGRRTDADDESAAYRITGCIDRNANAASTSLVGTPTVTVISEDTAAWDVDAVADTTNGSLNFRVTGEAGKAIRWVGWVRLVEVTG